MSDLDHWLFCRSLLPILVDSWMWIVIWWIFLFFSILWTRQRPCWQRLRGKNKLTASANQTWDALRRLSINLSKKTRKRTGTKRSPKMRDWLVNRFLNWFEKYLLRWYYLFTTKSNLGNLGFRTDAVVRYAQRCIMSPVFLQTRSRGYNIFSI